MKSFLKDRIFNQGIIKMNVNVVYVPVINFRYFEVEVKLKIKQKNLFDFC